ncbi:hypothetical protein [Sorangium sp. So ce1335]|uniref:hypothetical protein n=1 Tax=Sorangium sp. So ce1335 TaxID=3133335 RepID=UPI003F630370
MLLLARTRGGKRCHDGNVCRAPAPQASSFARTPLRAARSARRATRSPRWATRWEGMDVSCRNLCQPGSPVMTAREHAMNKIQNVLLHASFLGLVVIAVPGCPGESESPVEQTPAEQAQAICAKFDECGELGEGRTAQQCATDLEKVYDATQTDDLCGPLVQKYQTAMACLSQEMSCEDLDDGAGEEGGPSKGEPCFEEVESAEKALDEAKKRDPERAESCALVYALSVMAAQGDSFFETPEGHGAQCTTAEECPAIECPDPEHSSQVCLNGACATEEDLCE